MSTFSKELIVKLSKEVASGIKQRTQKQMTADKRSEVVREVFQQVLRENKTPPAGWKELKSLIGKEMNEWRRRKELLLCAREVMTCDEDRCYRREDPILSGLYPESCEDPEGEVRHLAS